MQIFQQSTTSWEISKCTRTTTNTCILEDLEYSVSTFVCVRFGEFDIINHLLHLNLWKKSILLVSRKKGCFFHIKITSGWVNYFINSFLLWVPHWTPSAQCLSVWKVLNLLWFCTLLTLKLICWCETADISHSQFQTVKHTFIGAAKHLLKALRVALWDTFSSGACVTWTSNHRATWLHQSRANPGLTPLTITNFSSLRRPKPPLNYIMLPVDEEQLVSLWKSCCAINIHHSVQDILKSFGVQTILDLTDYYV